MKKRNKLCKKFYEPLFKVEVWLLTGYEPVEIEKWFKSRKIERDDQIDISEDIGGYWRIPENSKYPHIVWVRKFDNYYTLTHELVHLALAIMKNKGIPVDLANEEMIAYLVEYYVKTFWREISK